METIEMDFDVFKALTARRASASVTYNDVLRELLHLDRSNGAAPSKESTGVPWTTKGVSFPHSTEFRAEYKGQSYTGYVENGALVVDGKRYTSPSAAAMAITDSPVNGWRFWQARRPGQVRWSSINTWRK